MKEQVKELFAAVTMPEKTQQKVLDALAEKQAKSPSFLGRRVAAIAAMLVLILALSPEVRAAVKEWVEVLIFEDGITLYETKDENGSSLSIIGYDTESPAWAEMREDRLYFLGHGQQIDITDQITEEAPYFYEYTDENGYRHFMAVGYSGELSNFGIYEFIQNPDGSWLTGAGRNFLATEKVGDHYVPLDCRYPWVDIVWEELNIPWPKPGEDCDDSVSLTENADGEPEAIGKK